MTFSTIFGAIVPVFLVVAVGCVVRRFRMIPDSAESGIMNLSVNVLFPAFILTKIPGNRSLQDVSVVVAAVLAGFGVVVLGLGICYVFSKVLGLKRGGGRRTFCVSTGIQNYGFLPIPLIVALFPEVSGETLGVLFVHNLGVEIAMWTVGVMMLRGHLRGWWKPLINGPLVAIVVGLFLNFSGLYIYIPKVIHVAMDSMGTCAIPLSLLLIGVTLTGVLEGESRRIEWRVVTGATLLRFALLPVGILFLAKAMVFSPELQRVLVMQAAMPTAIFPIVLSRHYGGHPATAVQVALSSSLLGLVLTPVLLKWGMGWIL